MKEFWLGSERDLADLVGEWGFVPFFKNEIEGFSVEEHTPPRLWFSEEAGPWEWKGPVIRSAHCAYGKLYRGKACYVSGEFYPDLANWRRNGYDYDSRMDEGIARRRDNDIMRELFRIPSLISKDLKSLVCYTPARKKEFEGSIVYLQMQCYVNIADFEYAKDKHGKEYGWGLARYTTPEAFFGEAFTSRVYAKEPEESREFLRERLSALLPHASAAQLDRFLG